MSRSMKSIVARVAGAVLLGSLCRLALAVDGVILIDQNKALAGNVTPGDAPGFPVTISLPGSYRLASNLVVPNADTTAVEITASNVSLDLNGFTILGTTNCAGGLFPCAGAGAGNGVGAPQIQFNITVTNGTIQGMGFNGILLNGDGHRIRDVDVVSNGAGGIAILQSNDQRGSIVEHSIAQRNGGPGILVNRGIVRHSVADVNVSGIVVSVGSVHHNTASRNATVGLFLETRAGYLGNEMTGNGVSGVTGGVNLGQNLCDTVVCP